MRLGRVGEVVCSIGLWWGVQAAVVQAQPTGQGAASPPSAATPATGAAQSSAPEAPEAPPKAAPGGAPAGTQPAASPAQQTQPTETPEGTPPPQPPAAGTAPPAPPDNLANPEGFDLVEALRGNGPAMTSIDAAKRAAKTSPSVAKAQAAAQKAEAAANQANVALYPRLELEARYTRLSPVEVPTMLRSFLRIQQDQGLFQARLSYPVSALFFSAIPRHKAALQSAQAQQLQAKVQRQTVKLQTREAYYNYARARAAAMVAKSALAQAEAHRRDSEALVNAGSIARVELMRAEAQVASAKVALARAENAVATARSALYTLVHLDGDQDITISEDLEEPLPPLLDSQDSFLARALERRSEIKAFRLAASAQEHSIDSLQGQQLPVVAIGGTAEEANPNQRVFGAYKKWNATWAAFASIVWSPNDTGSASTQVDQARADLASTLADLQQMEDSLRVEISQAYNGYQTAHASLEAARAGIAAAEESYRVRHEQFRAGAAIAVDVIDAEGQLRQARLDLVNTLIDLRIAKARLDRAVEAE